MKTLTPTNAQVQPSSELKMFDRWRTESVQALINRKTAGGRKPAFLFLGQHEADLLRNHLGTAFGAEYKDWVRISLADHHTLPLYMVDARVTRNFIANPEAPTLGPLLWLLPVLGTDAYIKLLIAVFSAAGLVGMFLLLRDFEVDPAPATVPAGARISQQFAIQVAELARSGGPRPGGRLDRSDWAGDTGLCPPTELRPAPPAQGGGCCR